MSELALAAFQYPNVAATPPNLTADWHQNSFNLYMGSCFTYQRRVEEEQSQIMAETIVFNQNGNELAKGWTLVVFVHNSGMFFPSPGISADYLGQQYLGIK